MALLSGFFWAASAIWQKKKYSPGQDLLDVTAWQMLFGGGVLLILALSVGPWHIEWTPGFAAALFYNAVPGNALAWLLWVYALHRLPSGVAGMGTLLAPAVGILSAWLQLSERPGVMEASGMGLIFLAMFLVAWEHLKTREEFPFPSPQE